MIVDLVSQETSSLLMTKHITIYMKLKPSLQLNTTVQIKIKVQNALLDDKLRDSVKFE
jgi:hypothetical protein